MFKDCEDFKLNYNYNEAYKKYILKHPQDENKIEKVLKPLIKELNGEFEKAISYIRDMDINDPLSVFLVSTLLSNSEKLSNCRIVIGMSINNFNDIDNCLKNFLIYMKCNLSDTILTDYATLNKYIMQKLEEHKKQQM